MAESTSRPAPDENDTQRKFREALERKRAKGRAAQGEPHLSQRGIGSSNNDKSTRRFRRKSGG